VKIAAGDVCHVGDALELTRAVGVELVVANRICAAVAEQAAVVVKTDMINWELEDEA